MPEDSLVVLGFDFGMKRIGVAIGQRLLKTAQPLTVLRAKDGIPNWRQIQQLIDEWQPQALVVGVPLQLDDSEQLMTLAARRFANRLRARFCLPVHEAEERFTSIDARKQQRSLRQSKATPTVDHYAAQLILEAWFND